MSYNIVNPSTGDATLAAGRGRAEYGASTIRKGTISFENISTPQWATASVVFDTPMPTADYEIILNTLDGYVIDGMTSPLTISNKTINGFSVKIYVHVLTSFRIGYTAFKLYSDVEYNNIVNAMPSNASSSNKLATRADIPNINPLVEIADCDSIFYGLMYCGTNTNHKPVETIGGMLLSFMSGTVQNPVGIQIFIPYNGHRSADFYFRDNTNAFSPWRKLTGEIIN